MTFDEKDRPITSTYADGSSITNTYDALGRLVKLVRNGTGSLAETFVYQLDAADRLQQLTRTAGTTVTTLNYQYDSLNRVVSRQVNGESTSYTYDKVGRILTLPHKAQTTAYTWDAASRLTQKTLPNNIKQQMVYDDAKLVPLRDKAANNTVLEQLDYAYDARGQRISKTTLGAYPIAREAPIQATYNAANRLTSLDSKSKCNFFSKNGGEMR